jgi:hypothetical protein
MRTILTLAALFACIVVLRAETLEQKARQYAASSGHSYEMCLNALEVGMWCKANPQGGVLYGKTYDAKATAEILATATRLLTEAKRPESSLTAEELRQRQQAQQYAVATGHPYDVCLNAIETYEWCMSHPQGGRAGGVTHDAASVTRNLATAMEVLQIKPAIQAAAPAAPAVAPAGIGRVIESSIDGDFEGFEGEKVFKLLNGQVWQQMDFTYQYHYAYGPRVMIYQAGGRTMMKVDGVDKPVRVMQLR